MEPLIWCVRCGRPRKNVHKCDASPPPLNPIGPEVCSEHGWVGGAAYYRDGHDKHDRRDSSG